MPVELVNLLLLIGKKAPRLREIVLIGVQERDLKLECGASVQLLDLREVIEYSEKKKPL